MDFSLLHHSLHMVAMHGRNFQKVGAEVARTVSDERAFDGWFFLLWIEHQ
jgi:hypothetical protein